MLIELVADFVCPWCYLGKRRLEAALALRPGEPGRILWRSFLLNPDLPPTGLPFESYIAAKFGGLEAAHRVFTAIEEAGDALGIPFAFERIRLLPNSLSAHRLRRWSARFGAEDRVAEALFRAFFVEGRNIADPTELTAIAAEAGLDAADARRFLAGGGEISAIQAEHQANHRLGIKGVPCFIVDGKYALSGAQDPEFFLPLFDIAREEERRLQPA
jgi:predicted DsbA family dithiol-disulfide isomerase